MTDYSEFVSAEEETLFPDCNVHAVSWTENGVMKHATYKTTAEAYENLDRIRHEDNTQNVKLWLLQQDWTGEFPSIDNEG